jgi:putative sugar O-methyltransferase
MMRDDASIPQARDEPELLELMLQDLRAAPGLYKPGNYWANYERVLVPELREMGLRNFRRRRRTILSTFGATDYSPSSAALNRDPFDPPASAKLRLKQLLLGLVFNIKPALRILNSLVEAYVGGSRGGVQRLCYEFAKCYGEKSGARSLDQLSASTVGNPEDVFTANGNTYTTSVLQYYILYA